MLSCTRYCECDADRNIITFFNGDDAEHCGEKQDIQWIANGNERIKDTPEPHLSIPSFYFDNRVQRKRKNPSWIPYDVYREKNQRSVAKASLRESTMRKQSATERETKMQTKRETIISIKKPIKMEIKKSKQYPTQIRSQIRYPIPSQTA